MVKFVQAHPWVISLLILAAAGAGVVRYQEGQAGERVEQICEAEIEDRVLLKNLVDFLAPGSAAPSAPSPQTLPEPFGSFIATSRAESRLRAEAFRDFAYSQLEIPPKICRSTGIDIQDFIDRLPEQQYAPGNTTSTTTRESEQ